MGQLIKFHLARLVVMSAAACQVAAAIHAFFWPKIFWDFSTQHFNILIKPVPVLQFVNLFLGLLMLSFEWPVGFLKGIKIQRSVRARFIMIPMSSLAAILLYQGFDCSIYYLIGLGIYVWGFYSGEEVITLPWTIPIPQ